MKNFVIIIIAFSLLTLCFACSKKSTPTPADKIAGNYQVLDTVPVLVSCTNLSNEYTSYGIVITKISANLVAVSSFHSCIGEVDTASVTSTSIIFTSTSNCTLSTVGTIVGNTIYFTFVQPGFSCYDQGRATATKQ